MKWVNKGNLLIIIMLCLAMLMFNIYKMREGAEFDPTLTILNQDTKGSCIYDEKGVNDLNTDYGIRMSSNLSDPNVVDGYKKACGRNKNQVMCERAYEPGHKGEHVITYCDWEFGGE